jgi:hypothetical protein
VLVADMEVSLIRRILGNAGKLQQHLLEGRIASLRQRLDILAAPSGGRRADRCEDIVALLIEYLSWRRGRGGRSGRQRRLLRGSRRSRCAFGCRGRTGGRLSRRSSWCRRGDGDGRNRRGRGSWRALRFRSARGRWRAWCRSRRRRRSFGLGGRRRLRAGRRSGLLRPGGGRQQRARRQRGCERAETANGHGTLKTSAARGARTNGMSQVMSTANVVGRGDRADDRRVSRCCGRRPAGRADNGRSANRMR